MKKFPLFKQLDAMDCGPSCLRMIAMFYGKHFTLQTLREECSVTREGVSLLGISDAAEKLGFRTIAARTSFKQLRNDIPLPCIVHWEQKHFVVVYKLTKTKVWVADPSEGLTQYETEEFLQKWIGADIDSRGEGIALVLEPTPDFYAQEDEKINKTSCAYLLAYLRPYKTYILQLIGGLALGSLLQLIFPFLTQSIIDIGINNQNIGFVRLVLAAQLMLFFSRTSVTFIRDWILLHVSTRINISLISDFLIKLMKLPIAHFDTKLIGDILQRINDHKRIESFLTSSTLSILFSLINFVIFGIVLAVYSLKILAVFTVGTLFYFGWIFLFMNKRRSIDHRRFSQLSANQNVLIQMIGGMQEIKQNNCEKEKRWEWERIQAKLFRLEIKNLSLEQYQHAGAFFITQSQNIFITFLAAEAVINGRMTLGMMLAVQYIIGQLGAPVEQIIYFMHTYQDAKISMERLGEIHNLPDEETPGEFKITAMPQNTTIEARHLSFNYDTYADFVLDDISIKIPAGKITAAVGKSGSGKTTLMKLLLGYYKPARGEIMLGNINLHTISHKLWRSKCGVVMQDGFIFSDTIARNITLKDEIDRERLVYATEVAKIDDFIQSLPLHFNTKIGPDGHGLSQGQKQRILIARAVYKNPEFLFFDEATNALDSVNERLIIGNLKTFFKNRTVFIIAHRLSTVKYADQILVLEKGQAVESGRHEELISQKGCYYDLVRNQLELDRSG